MKRLLLFIVLCAVPVFSQGITCPTGVNHCASIPGTGQSVDTSFNVYRTVTSGGCATVNPLPTGCVKAGTTTTFPFLDSPLAPSTTYFWVATGVNSAGESAPSNQVTGTTGPDLPLAPTLNTPVVK